MTKEVCTVNSLDHRVRVPGSENIKQGVLRLHLFMPQWQFVTRVEAPLNTVSIYLHNHLKSVRLSSVWETENNLLSNTN